MTLSRGLPDISCAYIALRAASRALLLALIINEPGGAYHNDIIANTGNIRTELVAERHIWCDEICYRSAIRVEHMNTPSK